MKRQSVTSSNLKAVGYDPKQRILELQFSNDRVYQYKNVEKAVHDDLMHAPSLGKFFYARILHQYDETEVSEGVSPEGNPS